MTNARRSDFDVTDTVQVSSPQAVLAAVESLYRPTWPKQSLAPLRTAFEHFERLFAGEIKGYYGVDTVYHDRQHTLDVTLALARLIVGYERQAEESMRLGGERAIVGIVVGLFHDVGYLRRVDEESRNGAEFTRTHVSRGSRFLEDSCRSSGSRPGRRSPARSSISPGYELPFAQIEARVPDPRDIKLGHLIGTADMVGQMADRCYLEKCRDRLYAEFVLGGVALPMASNGGRQVKYASGLDLLRQTPDFVAEVKDQASRRRVPRGLPPLRSALRRFATRTWRQSTATWPTCARSCAARTGGCCGAIRRFSPLPTTRWPPCGASCLGISKRSGPGAERAAEAPPGHSAAFAFRSHNPEYAPVLADRTALSG